MHQWLFVGYAHQTNERSAFEQLTSKKPPLEVPINILKTTANYIDSLVHRPKFLAAHKVDVLFPDRMILTSLIFTSVVRNILFVQI